MIKRLTTNVGWLFIAQIFNYLAPLLVLPYLTRTLPQNEFGAVMVAFSAVQICFVITDYGFSLSATQAIAQSDRSPAAVNNIIASIFTAKMFLCSIAAILVVLLSFTPTYIDHQSIFLAAIGTIIFQAFQPTWLFHGLERMKAYVLCSAFTKASYVAIVFLLVEQAGHGWRVQAAWSLANMFGTIISLYLIHSFGYRVAASSIADARSQLAHSAQFFASRIAVAAYTSAATLFVSLAGMQQAALYATAEQLYKAAQNLTSPVNQALYPLMARDRNWRLFFSVFVASLTCLIVGCIVIWYSLESIVTLLFGAVYATNVAVYEIFLVTVLANYIGVAFGYSACSALNIIRVANVSVIVGAAMFLLSGLGLVYANRIEAQTVACLVLLVETLVMGIRIFFVRTTLRQVKESQKSR